MPPTTQTPISSASFFTALKTIANSMGVVAPTPFAMTKIFSPVFNFKALETSPNIIFAVSSADKTLHLPPPPSPCCPMPISISSSPSSVMGSPFWGWVQPLIATAKVAMRELNFWAISRTSSKLFPSSAAAPATFMRGMQPASPRLSAAGVSTPALISSATKTLFTLIPSRSAIFIAIFALITSPAWFSTISNIPASRLNLRRPFKRETAFGAAKMSPTTLQSNIPNPTKPLNAGSCPEPPRVKTATLPSGFGRARTTSLPSSSFILFG